MANMSILVRHLLLTRTKSLLLSLINSFNSCKTLMAAETKTTSIVPLNGTNYPAWQIQCRMALMKDGLWKLIDGTEVVSPQKEVEKYAKYVAKKNKALAIVVLSVEPSLFYLLEEPQNPVIVWNKLAAQFQKKPRANKLAVQRKLYSLLLKEIQSVLQHIEEVTEGLKNFESLAILIKSYLFTGKFAPSFDALVTAFEANEDVPQMEW